MNATMRRRARRLLAASGAMSLVGVPAGAEVIRVLGLVTVATAGESADNALLLGVSNGGYAEGTVAVSNGNTADGWVAVSNGGTALGFIAAVAHDGQALPGGNIFGGTVGLTAVSTTQYAESTVAVSGTGNAGDCSTGQVSVTVTGNACGRAVTVSVLGDASGGIVNIDLQ